MTPSTLGVRLQTSWRDIVDAERQRGQALADAANVAEAQLVYEAALERFRHTQIELFTVALGNLELLREQGEAQQSILVRLSGEVALLRGMIETLVDTAAARPAGA